MKVFKEINTAARLLYEIADFERAKYDGIARNKRKKKFQNKPKITSCHLPGFISKFFHSPSLTLSPSLPKVNKCTKIKRIK